MTFHEVKDLYQARYEECKKVERDTSMTGVKKGIIIKEIWNRYSLPTDGIFTIDDTLIVKNVRNSYRWYDVDTDIVSFRAPKKKWVFNLKIGQEIGVSGKFLIFWDDDYHRVNIYAANTLIPKMAFIVDGKKHDFSLMYFEI